MSLDANEFEFFRLRQDGALAWLWLNRPGKRNLMNAAFWRELPEAVGCVEAEPDVSTLVVAAEGDDFSLGLDFKDFLQRMGDVIGEDTVAHRRALRAEIKRMQAGFLALAESRLVTIGAAQGHCLGAGLDLLAACDLRLCSAGANFSVRETRVGLVADLGALHRLPHILGEQRARQMAFTAMDVDAATAERWGLVLEVLPDVPSLHAAADEQAQQVAAHAPAVLEGTKRGMNHAREHRLADNLDWLAGWNAAFLHNPGFRQTLEAFKKRS